jgi:hypothetical protein
LSPSSCSDAPKKDVIDKKIKNVSPLSGSEEPLCLLDSGKCAFLDSLTTLSQPKQSLLPD